ncbi:MAG: hypothetical protein HWN67_10330, partial [Candidatus Helarchaeota archaeon]|nr:hypothetical protein [Candidatus Helarchaeota archaeon]
FSITAVIGLILTLIIETTYVQKSVNVFVISLILSFMFAWISNSYMLLRISFSFLTFFSFNWITLAILCKEDFRNVRVLDISMSINKIGSLFSIFFVAFSILLNTSQSVYFSINFLIFLMGIFVKIIYKKIKYADYLLLGVPISIGALFYNFLYLGSKLTHEAFFYSMALTLFIYLFLLAIWKIKFKMIYYTILASIIILIGISFSYQVAGTISIARIGFMQYLGTLLPWFSILFAFLFIFISKRIKSYSWLFLIICSLNVALITYHFCFYYIFMNISLFEKNVFCAFFSISISLYNYAFTLKLTPEYFRKRIVPKILIFAVLTGSFSFFWILYNGIRTDFISSLFFTIDLGVFLTYLSLICYYWKISKEIWDKGWYLWIILPFINSLLLLLRSVKFIAFQFQIFNYILGIALGLILFYPILYKLIRKYSWIDISICLALISGYFFYFYIEFTHLVILLEALCFIISLYPLKYFGVRKEIINKMTGYAVLLILPPLTYFAQIMAFQSSVPMTSWITGSISIVILGLIISSFQKIRMFRQDYSVFGLSLMAAGITTIFGWVGINILSFTTSVDVILTLILFQVLSLVISRKFWRITWITLSLSIGILIGVIMDLNFRMGLHSENLIELLIGRREIFYYLKCEYDIEHPPVMELLPSLGFTPFMILSLSGMLLIKINEKIYNRPLMDSAFGKLNWIIFSINFSVIFFWGLAENVIFIPNITQNMFMIIQMSLILVFLMLYFLKYLKVPRNILVINQIAILILLSTFILQITTLIFPISDGFIYTPINAILSVSLTAIFGTALIYTYLIRILRTKNSGIIYTAWTLISSSSTIFTFTLFLDFQILNIALSLIVFSLLMFNITLKTSKSLNFKNLMTFNHVLLNLGLLGMGVFTLLIWYFFEILSVTLLNSIFTTVYLGSLTVYLIAVFRKQWTQKSTILMLIYFISYSLFIFELFAPALGVLYNFFLAINFGFVLGLILVPLKKIEFKEIIPIWIGYIGAITGLLFFLLEYIILDILIRISFLSIFFTSLLSLVSKKMIWKIIAFLNVEISTFLMLFLYSSTKEIYNSISSGLIFGTIILFISKLCSKKWNVAKIVWIAISFLIASRIKIIVPLIPDEFFIILANKLADVEISTKFLNNIIHAVFLNSLHISSRTNIYSIEDFFISVLCGSFILISSELIPKTSSKLRSIVRLIFTINLSWLSMINSWFYVFEKNIYYSISLMLLIFSLIFQLFTWLPPSTPIKYSRSLKFLMLMCLSILLNWLIYNIILNYSNLHLSLLISSAFMYSGLMVLMKDRISLKSQYNLLVVLPMLYGGVFFIIFDILQISLLLNLYLTAIVLIILYLIFNQIKLIPWKIFTWIWKILPIFIILYILTNFIQIQSDILINFLNLIYFVNVISLIYIVHLFPIHFVSAIPKKVSKVLKNIAVFNLSFIIFVFSIILSQNLLFSIFFSLTCFFSLRFLINFQREKLWFNLINWMLCSICFASAIFILWSLNLKDINIAFILSGIVYSILAALTAVFKNIKWNTYKYIWTSISTFISAIVFWISLQLFYSYVSIFNWSEFLFCFMLSLCTFITFFMKPPLAPLGHSIKKNYSIIYTLTIVIGYNWFNFVILKSDSIYGIFYTILISSLFLQILPYFEIIKSHYWKFFYVLSAFSGGLIIFNYLISLDINPLSVFSLSILVGILFSSPLLFSGKKEHRNKIFNIFLIVIAIDAVFIIFSSIGYILPPTENYQFLIQIYIIMIYFKGDERFLWNIFWGMYQSSAPQLGIYAPPTFFALGVISLILFPLFMRNERFQSYRNVYFGFTLSMFVGYAYWMVLALQFSDINILLHEIVPMMMPILVGYIPILKSKESDNGKFLKIRFGVLIILIICSIFLFFDVLAIFFNNIFKFSLY